MRCIFRGRRSTWDVSYCVYFARIALSGLREVVTTRKFHGRRGMLWHEMTLRTPHSTLYSLHSTLYILQFTLYTLHSTHWTPHSTLYTLHSTLYILHSTFYTPHSTLHTPQFSLYTLHSTLYTLHSTLHTLHFALHTLRSTLYTPHSTVYTLHSTLHTPYSTLYTLHSTLFRIPQSTAHWYGNKGKCTRLFKYLVSQKRSMWLHSGSWAASRHVSWLIWCGVIYNKQKVYCGCRIRTFGKSNDELYKWMCLNNKPKDILKLDMNMFWIFLEYTYIYIYNQLAWDDWVMTGKCFEVYWGYFLLDIVTILNIQ